jgi:hypothetical protein
MPATPGRIPVWATPLSLAATYGINVFFFSCRYLDVSVPCVRSTCPMRSGRSDGGLLRRVSAFRNLRIDARLPAPRSFSQAAASFVASRCQDIHHTPLRVWPHLSITVNHRIRVATCQLLVAAGRTNNLPSTPRNLLLASLLLLNFTDRRGISSPSDPFRRAAGTL